MTKILEGARPSIPDDLDEDLKQLMIECWDEDQTKRPDFSNIVQRLQAVAGRVILCGQ